MVIFEHWTFKSERQWTTKRRKYLKYVHPLHFYPHECSTYDFQNMYLNDKTAQFKLVLVQIQQMQ
jgi:hypothetical protein